MKRLLLHALLALALFWLAVGTRFGLLAGLFPPEAGWRVGTYLLYGVLFALFFVGALAGMREYDRATLFRVDVFWWRATSALAGAVMLLVLLSYLLQVEPPSRLVVVLLLFGGPVLLGGWAWVEGRISARAPRFLLLGDHEEELLVRMFPNARWERVKEEDLRERLAERPDALWIGGDTPEDLQRTALQLAWRYHVPVRLLARGPERLLRAFSVEEWGGLPVVTVYPLYSRLSYRIAKRAIDLAGALVLLVLTLPLWVLLLVLIPLESPGPPLFRHRRLGLHGRPFYVWKFRTMYADAEERLRRDPELARRFRERFKLEDDPRVTRLGRLLRKWSLDELPQLWNVLLGEMSLVGPRPIVPEEIPKYGEWADLLFSVKPGLTGLWQVSGRSELPYERRVELDLYYILNWTPLLDLQILLKTPLAVLRGRGAV